MKVMIAGAKSETGQKLIEYLEQKGEDEIYTWMSDSASHAAHSVKGMDAVIFADCAGPDKNPDEPLSEDERYVEKLIETAKANGVQHFVLLSSMGADDPQGEAERYLLEKRKAEDTLVNSGLNFTIIRTGVLTSNEPTGKVKLAETIEQINDYTIARGDVARVLALSLDYDNLKNKTVEVISGEDLIEEAMTKV